MKKITRTSAVLISLALTLTSVPLPAFSAVTVQTQVSQSAVSGGVPGLPVNTASQNLGNGSLLTPASRMDLGGTLALPQSPIVAAPGGQAAQTLAAPVAAVVEGPGAPVVSAVPAAAAPVMAAPAEAPNAGLAALAAEASAQPPAEPAQGKGLIGRLASALAAKFEFGRVFDNSGAPAPGAVAGILPQKTVSLPGVALDEAPSAPDPRKVKGVAIESYDLPGNLNTGADVFNANPSILQADPANEVDVERALRAMVDADPVKYGVPSSQLATVHVRRFAGTGQQADTIYAYFQQQQNGIAMHGAGLSFTIKVLQGKPLVMSSMAKLYPNSSVDTTPRFPDDELKAKALERLGPAIQSKGLKASFLEKKIIYVKGAWHASNIYVIQVPQDNHSRTVMIGVDVATGEAFSWDPTTLRKPKAQTVVSVDPAPVIGPLVSGDDHIERGRTPSSLFGLKRPQSFTTLSFSLSRGEGLLVDDYLKSYFAKAGLEYRTNPASMASGRGIIISVKGSDQEVGQHLKNIYTWHRDYVEKSASIQALAASAQETGVSGTFSGKSVEPGPIMPGAEVTEIPLAYLEVKIGGKTYLTDENGFFTADPTLVIAPEGLQLTAELSGPHARIEDSTGKTLSVNVLVKPGDGALKVVFNPDSDLSDENSLAQVSAFHNVNADYMFLRARKLTTDKMDQNAIVVRTNIDDECNAYYTPGQPSLNFFKSSQNCVNSSYATVSRHEYGHYWDDMTGGIVNGGLSEGWGDTLSMFSLNNPIIGEHFMKNPRPGPDGKPIDYIRDGNNTYQYTGESDEVHDIGQAWGGFNWKVRKALMAKFGDAAGAALAESLILPTMFAKAANVPAAMAQVLLADMDSHGNMPHETEIRAAAAAHGVTLPKNPGQIASLAWRMANGVMSMLATAGEDGPALQRPQTRGPRASRSLRATNTIRNWWRAPGNS